MNETNSILARLDALERKTGHLDTEASKTEIKTLQNLIVTLEGETRVLRWVLQSIIACHPEPSRLRTMFESFATGIASGMQDAGFEADIPPEQMRRLLSKTAESVVRWDEALSKPQ